MRFRIGVCAAVLGLVASASSAQDIGCAGCWWQWSVGAEVQLTFAHIFTGTYRTGEPFDVVTIDPAGTSDTLDDVGITLRVRLYCDSGGEDRGPIAGMPADHIVLFTSPLRVGTGWFASTPTDSEGWTEFHTTMTGGGCAQSLDLYVDGCFAVTLPIKVNSPDVTPAGWRGPCAVDAGDIAALAEHLGNPVAYSICFDWNEDGAVDAGDVAKLSSVLGSHCD